VIHPGAMRPDPANILFHNVITSSSPYSVVIPEFILIQGKSGLPYYQGEMP
jgi:hypothetical protein